MFVSVIKMRRLNNQIDFFVNEFGKDIQIYGSTKKGILSDASSNPSFYDDKYLIMKESYDTGTLLEYQNVKWMVISQVVVDANTYKAKIRRADWQIKLYVQNVLQCFYCIVDNLEATIEDGKVISTAVGEIKLYLQANANTNLLAISRRFIKFGSAWKITGIDKSKVGLIIIYAEKDLFTDKDDKDNEIADRWSYEEKHIYTISITDLSPINMEIGETRKLNYQVYDTGTLMTTFPEVVFEIENTQFATIDSAGNITAVLVGETAVTCKLKATSTISASCIIKVVQEIVKEYTITLTYPTKEISVGGYASTFTATVFYGGVQVTDKTVLWKVTDINGAATNIVTLTNKGNNSCTVSAPENYDNIDLSVILTAYLSDDNNVKNTVTLKLVLY
jgi:hypothetical protein